MVIGKIVAFIISVIVLLLCAYGRYTFCNNARIHHQQQQEAELQWMESTNITDKKCIPPDMTTYQFFKWYCPAQQQQQKQARLSSRRSQSSTVLSSGNHYKNSPSSSSSILATKTTPNVFLEETFSIRLHKDITYATALSHTVWGGDIASVMHLKVDIYEPVDRDTNATLPNRPAILLFHGGAFRRGSKERAIEQFIAQYFCTRGWVVFFPNYRLAGHKGTLPKILSGAATLPANLWNMAKKQLWNMDANNGNNVLLSPFVNVLDTLFENMLAMYPAGRDAKAALRFVHAQATNYSVNTDHISVLGGSAGGMLATMLALSSEHHYRDEISLEDDATLDSTHLRAEPTKIATVINGWGGSLVADFGNFLNRQTYAKKEAYPPILSVHSLWDVNNPHLFSLLLHIILRYYLRTHHEFITLPGSKHQIYNVTVKAEQKFPDVVHEFIVRHQQLELS